MTAQEDLPSPTQEQGSAPLRAGAVPGPHFTTRSTRDLARRVRAPGRALRRSGPETEASLLTHDGLLRSLQATMLVLVVLLQPSHPTVSGLSSVHPSHGRPQGLVPEDGHQGGVGRAQAHRAEHGTGWAPKYAGSQRLASKMDARWFAEDNVQYYATDHLGSTNFTFDSDQRVVSHTEYFPSGEVWRSETAPAYAGLNPYSFTGKEWDAITGLYDFGARQYDPRLGQWLSPDPAFDGLNLYAYVHNNPLNMVDPFGLSAEADEWTEHEYSDEISGMNGEAADLGVHWRGKGTDVWQAEQDAGDARAAAYAKSAANEGWHQLRDEPLNYQGFTPQELEVMATVVMTFAPTGGAFGALGSRLASQVATRAMASAERAWIAQRLAPAILSNQAAGKIIGWPTGQAAARRTAEMARNLTAEQVAAMEAQGLNRATVEGLRGTYQRAIESGGAKLRNEQLLPRAELMDRILELWPK